MNEYYIVGKFLHNTSKGVVWDFMGLFSSEEKAVEQCKSEIYFVAPVYLNGVIQDETVLWPGMYYPLGSKK